MTWQPEIPNGPPVRMQLSRKAGFYLHGASVFLNGRHAVSVARPSKWGNPFKVAPAVDSGGWKIPAITAAVAVELFRERMTLAMQRPEGRRPDLSELRGKNLACWCKIISHDGYSPCHADVLLSLANDIPMEEVIRENTRWAEGQAL